MDDTGWYRWVCTLMYVAVTFAEVTAGLWTKATTTSDVEMIGDISSRAMSRSHCALICGMQEMCYGFEYHNKTNMCDVFYGVQSLIGSQSSTNSRYSVFTYKEECEQSGYIHVVNESLCFKIFEEEMTWYDANSKCSEEKGRLVVLRNSGQVEALLKHDLGNTTWKLWIGLTDSENEGIWKWVDNTTFDPSIWHLVQFNDYSSSYEADKFTADCAAFIRNGYNLIDEHCESTGGFVCERPQLL